MSKTRVYDTEDKMSFKLLVDFFQSSYTFEEGYCPNPDSENWEICFSTVKTGKFSYNNGTFTFDDSISCQEKDLNAKLFGFRNVPFTSFYDINPQIIKAPTDNTPNKYIQKSLRKDNGRGHYGEDSLLLKSDGTFYVDSSESSGDNPPNSGESASGTYEIIGNDFLFTFSNGTKLPHSYQNDDIFLSYMIKNSPLK